MSEQTNANWTKELPTALGYYWWRENDVQPPVVLLVHPDGVWYGVVGEYIVPSRQKSGKQMGTVAELGGEWHGPMSPSATWGPLPEGSQAIAASS